MSALRKRGSTGRIVTTFKRYFAPKNIFTKEDRKFRLNWWQILCGMAFAALVCLLLDRAGRFDLSRPILGILGSLFIAIRLRWGLRDRVWFWVTILIFIVLAGFCMAAETWNTKGPSGPIIGGVMGISVYFLFVVLHALEIHSERASNHERKPSQSGAI
jgi:hypothetical protein